MTEQEKVEGLVQQVARLSIEKDHWQAKYYAQLDVTISEETIIDTYTDKAIIEMGNDARERLYNQVSWALERKPRFKDTGDLIVVGDTWGEIYFGVIGYKLLKLIKQRKLSDELLFKMHDFFFNENEVLLEQGGDYEKNL